MRNRFRRPGSAGFSLVEMLIVVSMIGLMALVAWPKVAVVFNQSQLRSARLAVLNKFNQARMIARQSSRHTYLMRADSIFWIERQPRLVPHNTDLRDTVGTYLNVMQYGVTVTGINTLTIDPRGLARTAGTFILTRQGLTDSVAISGWGNVIR
jgi:prepilin-type N-terminal cleavage/methylation domain-containing protein